MGMIPYEKVKEGGVSRGVPIENNEDTCTSDICETEDAGDPYFYGANPRWLVTMGYSF